MFPFPADPHRLARAYSTDRGDELTSTIDALVIETRTVRR